MFAKVCLFVCFLAYATGFERGDWDQYGPFNMALNSPRVLNCVLDLTLDLDVSGIKIYFFDFANNFNTSFPINEAASGILGLENLDKSRKFVMFVGGFTSHINHDIERQMREAYKTQPDMYLIIPDHSQYTNNRIGNIAGYEQAVTHIPYIGAALGQMWADVSAGGVPSGRIEFVGHSLGGQALGYAGAQFLEARGEAVSRVSALDPAGPCFVNSLPELQVRSGVANFVQVYHCNAGALGSANLLGDADFILNKNGATQPNCGAPMMPVMYSTGKAAACAHRTCVDFWTASVKHGDLFEAYSCESYEDFRAGHCFDNEITVAGASNPGSAKGVFFLSTEKFDLKKLM